jgi:ABC-type transporter Mla maintaining outer membrane lipid asymmetry permease subunit MlaE
MEAIGAGVRPPLDKRVLEWWLRFVARAGHLWAENPWILATFTVRLLRAWRYLLFDLHPRQVSRTLWSFISETARTFVPGLFVVLGLSVTLGLGTGAVARAVGPLLQPVFASVLMTVLLRDAAPLVLIVLMASRMGGIIAAKLGSAEGIAGSDSPIVSDLELTRLALPHLVAGTITGAVFYSLGAYCIVLGYVSLGDPVRFVNASPDWFLELKPIRSALWFGVFKSMVFGHLVALVACALGIASRERALRGPRRVAEVQNAVWETSVGSILVATVLSVLLWLGVEAPLR